MKKIVIILAILLNVFSIFCQVTEDIEQTKARLRTICVEEGDPSSDLIELNNLLNAKSDGYAFKLQFTAIAIKDTYIRFQREAREFNGDQGFDIVFKFSSVLLYCTICDKKLPFTYYRNHDPVGFDWELPHNIVIALTDGGSLTVSVDGDQFYHYNHTLPHPINYVQFIQTHPYTSHTVFFYNCTSNEEPQCGKQAIENNTPLTSGVETREGDWPWHSAIWHTFGVQRRYACGGTLITSNAVLTAAHCLFVRGVRVIGVDHVIVQLGNQYLPLASPNTQEFRAHRLIIHSDYDRTTFRNDIAIVRLATQVTFTPYVRPICLWDDNRLALREVIDKNGVVVGWGFNERDELSEKLYQAFMPVIDSIDCLESYPDFSALLIRHTTFCAGFNNDTGACNRDSGGGMYFLENRSYYLRGIVSQTQTRDTRNVCDPKKYILFTDLAYYLQWVLENSK